MSSISKPNLAFDQIPAYTLTAGAIYPGKRNLTLMNIDIKWVNDIYYKDRKIANLTKATTSVETGLVTDIIIGVGFNFALMIFQKNCK